MKKPQFVTALGLFAEFLHLAGLASQVSAITCTQLRRLPHRQRAEKPCGQRRRLQLHQPFLKDGKHTQCDLFMPRLAAAFSWKNNHLAQVRVSHAGRWGVDAALVQIAFQPGLDTKIARVDVLGQYHGHKKLGWGLNAYRWSAGLGFLGLGKSHGLTETSEEKRRKATTGNQRALLTGSCERFLGCHRFRTLDSLRRLISCKHETYLLSDSSQKVIRRTGLGFISV